MQPIYKRHPLAGDTVLVSFRAHGFELTNHPIADQAYRDALEAAGRLVDAEPELVAELEAAAAPPEPEPDPG